jgi:hypothetical protein
MPPGLAAEARHEARAAAARAMTVSYDHFAGQVLPYLGDDDRAVWDAATWEDALLRVTTALEKVG